MNNRFLAFQTYVHVLHLRKLVLGVVRIVDLALHDALACVGRLLEHQLLTQIACTGLREPGPLDLVLARDEEGGGEPRVSAALIGTRAGVDVFVTDCFTDFLSHQK